jgi:flagellar basal-body rod modification protein FlgD
MTPAITSSSSSSDTTSGTTVTASKAVDKNMFLQLLVAQLRNQDPMNPSDGTAFVGQLAQFQQLEQSMNSAQDITAIRTDLDSLVAAAGSSTDSQA